MPYRRLPNTDQARLRALQAALQMGNVVDPWDLAYSQKLYLRLKSFLPLFEQAMSQYSFSKNKQAEYGRLLNEYFKEARLYVSHFLQVLNFCIIRGEIKPEVRVKLGLDINDKSVPDMGTEQQLIYWGEKIINGEHERMMMGGNRIYNPSIAIVKIKYEKFLEVYNNHKNLQITTHKMLDKVANMRVNADSLILHIWNEVEDKFDEVPGGLKRDKCSDYGIVYVFRKHEKEKV